MHMEKHPCLRTDVLGLESWNTVATQLPGGVAEMLPSKIICDQVPIPR
jgi:hypothetical protein